MPHFVLSVTSRLTFVKEIKLFIDSLLFINRPLFHHLSVTKKQTFHIKSVCLNHSYIFEDMLNDE